jgi:hypothetical protein
MRTNVDSANEARPFPIDVSEEQLEDLRRRIGATHGRPPSWRIGAAELGGRPCVRPRGRPRGARPRTGGAEALRGRGARRVPLAALVNASPSPVHHASSAAAATDSTSPLSTT